MKKLLALVLSAVFLCGTIIGCRSGESVEQARKKPYYDEWIDYTAAELQDIFWKHEEAFDYITEVLMRLEAKIAFRIVIEDEKKGNLLFFSYGNGKGEYTNGSELGYVKDKLFEQYVNEILIEEKFSRIYSSTESSRLIFGRGYPIWYNGESSLAYAESTEIKGNLKNHWFYYSQKAQNAQMKPGKPYYDEWIDCMAEELQSVFWEHEEAFDYIAEVILSLDRADFYIVIDDPEKGNLLFYSENPDSLFIREDPMINDYTDGSEFGYTKDELFERYVNEIIVGEKFSQLYVSRADSRILFGQTWSIHYNEKLPDYNENTPISGNLKKNWFYYVQSYI